MNKIFLVTIAMLFLTSCGKLSRTEAERIIRETYSLPLAQYAEIPKSYNIDLPDGNPHRLRIPGRIGITEINKLQKLLDLKLISVTESEQSHWTNFFGEVEVRMKHYEFSLTPENQQYYLGKGSKTYDFTKAAETMKIKTCDQDFGEITGMVEVERPVKSVVVEYTNVMKNPTPFAVPLGQNMSKVKTYKVTLMKYDDGWRIQ